MMSNCQIVQLGIQRLKLLLESNYNIVVIAISRLLFEVLVRQFDDDNGVAMVDIWSSYFDAVYVLSFGFQPLQF